MQENVNTESQNQWKPNNTSVQEHNEEPNIPQISIKKYAHSSLITKTHILSNNTKLNYNVIPFRLKIRQRSGMCSGCKSQDCGKCLNCQDMITLVTQQSKSKLAYKEGAFSSKEVCTCMPNIII